MIFPTVTPEEWINRYPVLEIVKRRCHFCRDYRIANIPFIEKDWIGLKSLDCACGRGKAISVSTPRSKEALAALERLF